MFCNRNVVQIRQNTNRTPSYPCHSLGVQNATLVVIYSQEGLISNEKKHVTVMPLLSTPLIKYPLDYMPLN